MSGELRQEAGDCKRRQVVETYVDDWLIDLATVFEDSLLQRMRLSRLSASRIELSGKVA
jgi:hypothetical protein